MDAAGFRELLERSVVLADGGMGTWLLAEGVHPEACLEALSLDDPGLVERAHRAFVEAGARLILTNTFGANGFRLDRHGRAGDVTDVCHAAVRIARDAGAPVLGGSMGPLGVRLQPYGRVRPEDAATTFAEQARALADAGVDVFVIETQTDLREMELAVLAARGAAPAIPVLASATFTRDDRTPLGSSPAEVASALAALGVDVIGVNCGEGPAQALRIIRTMRPAAAGTPLAARPNAGGPTRRGGRFVYPATPDYVAEVAQALLEEGVRVIGGCCGTGPAHTAALAAAVAHRDATAIVTFPPPEPPVAPAGAIEAPATALERALAAGAFPVAVEMEPPRSFDTATMVAAAITLRDAGATVVDVADSPMARMRMSAWAACRLIEEGAEIETVLHFPTRGRNLLRLQGDLLGAHALGIRNVFVVVGDPVAIGDYPQALNDVDVTATGLLQLITGSFNTGTDRAGSSIGVPTAFVPGAAVSPMHPDLDHEVRLLRRKVAAGARFLLSQPLYEPGPLVRLREAYERLTGEGLVTPILAGLLPLVSARHAAFLHNEVPGIEIPDAVRDAMEGAGDGEAAWRRGLEIATDAVAALADAGAAGVYLMPQFGRFDRAAEVVEAIAALSPARRPHAAPATWQNEAPSERPGTERPIV